VGDPISDELLQILLRSYTGLFADFVPIQEEVLAKRLGFKPDEVYERLLHFSRLGVIHYIPRKKSPYVIYQVNREAKERVRLTKAVYEERRERYQGRISSILAYAQDDQVCRSRQLLLYFGEKDGRNCGKCDVCLRKNASGLSNHDFEQIVEYIDERIEQNVSSVRQLVDESGFPADKVLKVIRFQADQGKWTLEGDQLRGNQSIQKLDL
jgi:ATP-dependent DNA helicase RecQ